MADVRDVVPSTLVGMAQTVNVPYALANCCGARVVNVSGASLDCAVEAHQLAHHMPYVVDTSVFFRIRLLWLMLLSLCCRLGWWLCNYDGSSWLVNLRLIGG